MENAQDHLCDCNPCTCNPCDCAAQAADPRACACDAGCGCGEDCACGTAAR